MPRPPDPGQTLSASAQASRRLVAHYEDCLARHGDNHRGVDWPDAGGADLRYAVMLGVIPPDAPRPVRLLDFGCGAGHLLEYIRRRSIPGIAYHGLELWERFLALCRGKFPDVPFILADVIEDDEDVPACDYVVMNGVFTEKRELSHEAMWDHVRSVLRRVWPHARRGLAFNVMSRQVDGEREALSPPPADTLMAFLKAELSRHVAIRHDYGL